MPDLAEGRWLAAAHALPIAEIAARWGVSAGELFAGLDVDVEALADPGTRLPIPVLAALAARAKALTGEPGLGFHLGLAMTISSCGYLGFAAMASPTVRDAIDLAVRFIPTRTNAIALRVQESGGVASIAVDELAPLGAARDVIVISGLVGMHQIGAALTGRRIEDSVDIAFPEPAHAARFRHLLGGRIRFDQPRHQIVFDTSVLDMPLAQANRAALNLARDQCERELAALGREGRVGERVRGVLLRASAELPSMDQVGAQLGMSPRTLRRRLAEEGTSFSAIVEEGRHHRALLLLRAPELPIEVIAADLGYADTANFTRAFRKWTGVTPSRYRRRSVG